MSARPIGKGTGLHVAGLYRTVLETECQCAEGPDPRLFLSLETPEQRAEWEQSKDEGRRLAALALDELLAAAEPIWLPRWALCGRIVPDVRGWAPYEDRRHQWFVLSADDLLTPA
jgi:hypothetical protein